MIVLGRIVAPYGVKGWIKLHPFGDDPLSWGEMTQWWLGKNPDSSVASDWSAHPLLGCKEHGKGFVAAFKDLVGREAAESITGLYIAAPRDALPKPAEDEYYWTDLIGLRVSNHSGMSLGTVRGLIDNGAHSVLDVVDGDAERLIPFVAAYVQKVSVAEGQIVVEWELDW